MKLKDALSQILKTNGIELDQDELDKLDEKIGEDPLTPDRYCDIDLSSPLPGRAAGMAEIFFTAPKAKPVEEGGLLWSPIAIDGQWALRPDGRGGKSRVPLRIVAGSSVDQRKQIGMADIVASFEDGAMEQVTIPSTHSNLPTENNGYVKQLRIVKAKIKGNPVSVLMAGEDFTDPRAKEKVLNGSTRGRSMGLLYDYQRTDDAKTFPIALEHVALTPKPWLRGMPQLSRPLKDAGDLATMSFALSDDAPNIDDEADTIEDENSVEIDFLADASPVVSWDHEDSPQWLRDQVDQILRAKRAEKIRANGSNSSYAMIDDPVISYRCVEAKPGFALIADNYGDGANYWVAPISVVKGEVQISDAKTWSATKKVWTPDDRPVPTGTSAPLADDELPITILNETEVVDPLHLAQAMRFERGRIDSTNLAMTAAERAKLKPSDYAVAGNTQFPIHTQIHAVNALARAKGTQHEATVTAAVKKRYPKMNIKLSNDPPRGGGKMTDPTQALQLSEQARALIQQAEDRAKAAEDKATNLAQTVDRLVGTVNGQEADTFIAHMKRDVKDGGLGLSEERGFGGMLREVHAVLLVDDGGPALQSDHFADDKNPTGSLNLSQVVKRIFGALRTAEGGVLKLGEIVTPPTEIKESEDLSHSGKPPKDDEKVDETNLSDDELLAGVPDSMLTGMGIKPGASAEKNGNGKEGESR